MKSFYFNLPAILVAVAMSLAASAQDIHFSQFYETPLYRNPALAGIVSGDVRVQAVYRTQWNSIANAYKTASLNAEYKMHAGQADDYMTAGVQLFYDRAGTSALTSTHLMPAFNYHKSLSAERNMYLSVGFMAGLVQRSIDRSKITTNSSYDGGVDGEHLEQNQFSYFDGAAGVSFNTGLGENPENNLVIGLGYHHFNHPPNTFYSNATMQLDQKWVLSADARLAVNEDAYLTIRSDFSKQGASREIIAGIMYGMRVGADPDNSPYTVHGGGFLRWNDSFIPTIRLDYHPFSVALSYDVNISPLKVSSYGRGGFELGLTYTGFLDRDNSSMNAIHCPRF